MCRDLEKLYYQACGLCRRLYYHHHNDPRYKRIYVKAEERRERRGTAYQECLEARDEMLSYFE